MQRIQHNGPPMSLTVLGLAKMRKFGVILSYSGQNSNKRKKFIPRITRI